MVILADFKNVILLKNKPPDYIIYIHFWLVQEGTVIKGPERQILMSRNTFDTGSPVSISQCVEGVFTAWFVGRNIGYHTCLTVSNKWIFQNLKNELLKWDWNFVEYRCVSGAKLHYKIICRNVVIHTRVSLLCRNGVCLESKSRARIHSFNWTKQKLHVVNIKKLV